jgi:thymidylate synthase (FAD)
MDNKVELIGYYGSDKVIALSAWTSTARDLSEEKEARIPKMIESLWMNGHETPFEKGVVHFLVDTEIASHIHFLKHRISSFNGESARYKELKEDKYYLPTDWGDIRSQCCSSIHDTDDRWTEVLEKYIKMGDYLYHQAMLDLEPKLGRKRAKESARFFKTYASQLQGDVSFNMRSFANFLKLRNSPHAQLEIREVAQQMLDLVKNIEENPFEHTLNSFELRNKQYVVR